MLNKEVCKQCCWHQGFEWTVEDDRYWQSGRVVCPGPPNNLADDMTIKREPPHWCLFSAEHAVSQNENR